MREPTIHELYRSDKVILWGINTPDDLAELIARRIEFYAIHPEVNAFTASLIPPKERNYLYSKEFPKIAYLIARDKIKYHKEYAGAIRDLGVVQSETIMSPVAVIRSIKQGKPVWGDCDCKTLFLGTLLANRGFKVRLVLAHILKHEPGENIYVPNHIYLEFAYPDRPDKWIPLDASGNRPFGNISPDIIPLKRFYVGMDRVEVVQEIGAIEQIPPAMGDALITAGSILRTLGEQVKKGQLEKKVSLIADFFSWLTKPYTLILLTILGIIIGWEVWKGLTRK